MSIIILAQSLKNDGTADIQIDGEFSPSPKKSLYNFYNDARSVKTKKCGNCGIEFGIVPGLLPINSKYYFVLNCEEKDDIGRNSPIAIQAKLTELQDIIPHLEVFLQKNGKTISDEKIESLKKIIDFKRNSLKALIKANN